MVQKPSTQYTTGEFSCICIVNIIINSIAHLLLRPLRMEPSSYHSYAIPTIKHFDYIHLISPPCVDKHKQQRRLHFVYIPL